MKTFKTFMMIVYGAILGTLLFVIQWLVFLNIASCVNFDVVRMTDVQYTDEGVTCYEHEYDTDLCHAIVYDEVYDLLFNDYVKVKSVTIKPLTI